MAYKPSESRYDKGGRVTYLVYESPQKLRDGTTQHRTRVKRLYFPGDSSDIKLEGPKSFTKRTGRTVHGVAVHYRNQQAETTAHRGETRYKLPARWADRTKIVELPEKASGAHLTDNPPKGPHVAVA
ncbi:MAG TPA: hypothetical protein VFY10_11685 [Dehalococcoidia bacterium]|nr:hypothetical protein [Dehalococcoidia bacterium]